MDYIGDSIVYRLIWFQHIHKAAGTLIVNMAKANSEKMYITNNNGNPTNDFLAVDAMLKYDLSNVFTIGKLEPFVGIGPGYTWFEDQKYLTGNLSVGANYWFSDVFGLTLMADYKNNYDDIRESLHYDEGGTMRWSAMLSMKF